MLSGVGGCGAAEGLSLLLVTTLCPSLSPSSLLSLLPRLPSHFISKSLGTLSPYSQVIQAGSGKPFPESCPFMLTKQTPDLALAQPPKVLPQPEQR